MKKLRVAGLLAVIAGTCAAVGQGGRLLAQSYPGTTAAIERLALGVTPDLPTTAALETMPLIGMTEGAVATRSGYYAAGDSPSATYRLSTSACSLNSGDGDDGSQIPSTTTGNCWLLSASTAYDPRWWGARGDVDILSSVVTTTAGSGSVSIASGAFTAGDVGKLITISQNIGDGTTSPAGASYQGTISAVTDATDITVTPAVGFATAVSQTVAYGHDDTTPLNAFAAYLSTIRVFAGDYVDANFGGATYGLSGPMNMLAGINYNHSEMVALSSAGFSCSNALVNVTQANTVVDKFVINSNYLPVNGYMEMVNGNTQLHTSLVYNWMGSCAQQTVTATSTASGSYVVDLSSAAGLSTFMVSRGNSGIPDRAMIVKVETDTGDAESPCPGSQCVVLNTPTTSTVSGSLTFYQDVNGIMAHGSNSGIHLFNDQAIEWNANDTAHKDVDANHYGCAFLHQGTQSDAIRVIFNEGVAPICVDSTNNGLNFYDAQVFPAYSSSTLNQPAIVIADGAQLIKFDGLNLTGSLQDFILNDTAQQFSLSGLTANYSNLSPNDVVQIYTNRSNTSLASVSLGAPDVLKSSVNYVSISGFGTCGTDYSYNSFTCGRLAYMAAQKSSILFNGHGMLLSGADLLGGTLSNGILLNPVHNTSTTLDINSECLSVWTINNGVTTPTMTLPAAAPAGCSVTFYANGSGTVSIAPESGAVLNGLTTPISLTQYIDEHCVVGRNGTGTAAEWSCK